MKKLNTRAWSTPIVIGAGLFVSISGVLMFFGIKNPIELAHEWIGLIFAIAIGLHVLNHWKPFKSYFSKRLAVSIVGSVALVTCVFIIASATQGSGNIMMAIIHSFEESPIAEVAPLLDQKSESIINKFKAAGFVVEGPDETIKDIASNNEVEAKTVMRVLFN